MLTSENFILMACCELEKLNLTIINIQRITHAFDRTFVRVERERERGREGGRGKAGGRGGREEGEGGEGEGNGEGEGY